MKLFKTYLKIGDLLELQELHRIYAMEKFKYNLVTQNTARVPNGQALRNQSEALMNLYQETKDAWMAHTLARYGYQRGIQVNINLMTGELQVDRTVPPILQPATK